MLKWERKKQQALSRWTEEMSFSNVPWTIFPIKKDRPGIDKPVPIISIDRQIHPLCLRCKAVFRRNIFTLATRRRQTAFVNKAHRD